MNKIIFLLFISLFLSSNSYFILPFYTEKIPDDTTEDNFILNLINSGLYSKIKIGSNSQELPVLINFISYVSYIINSTVNYNGPKYNSKESTSFIEGKKLNNFMDDIIQSGTKSYDIIDLGQVKLKNFTFILSSSFKNISLLREGGQIGLGIINIETTEDSFLKQLYNLNIIKKYPFSISYTKEDEGNLIFGDYLHDIKNSGYKNEEMITIPIEDIERDYYWSGSSNFIVNNKTLDYFVGFIINSQYGVSFANSEYFKSIQPFLKDKINNGKCKEKEVYIKGIFPDHLDEDIYSYYVCDKDVNLKEFPSLIVEISGNKFQIEFTYKDLWINFKDKNYLNILLTDKFLDTRNFYFSFGRMFLRKYDFTFDTERRIIGIYKKKPQQKDWKLLTVIIFIVLIVALFFLIRYIMTYYQMKVSKKTAHELTEDGFYQISD